jgi:hypothetical protein
MQAIAKMVTTKGIKWNDKCGTPQTSSDEIYRVDAPAVVVGTDNAIVKFQTCIFDRPAGAKASDYASDPDCPTVGGE